MRKLHFFRKRRFVYDYALCGPFKLPEVMGRINAEGCELICATFAHNTFFVFFRRPMDG